MIEPIFTVIASKLAELDFITKSGGIAEPRKIKVADKEKTFPAVTNTAQTACAPGKYILMIPESKETTVVYWEIISNNIKSRVSGAILYKAIARMVVWCNTARMNPPDPDVAAALMIDKLTGKLVLPISVEHLSKVRINFLQEEPKSPNIFRAYSYDEAELQYLMSPYGYFALQFEIDYLVNPKCLPSIEKIEPSC